MDIKANERKRISQAKVASDKRLEASKEQLDKEFKLFNKLLEKEKTTFATKYNSSNSSLSKDEHESLESINSPTSQSTFEIEDRGPPIRTNSLKEPLRRRRQCSAVNDSAIKGFHPSGLTSQELEEERTKILNAGCPDDVKRRFSVNMLNNIQRPGCSAGVRRTLVKEDQESPPLFVSTISLDETSGDECFVSDGGSANPQKDDNSLPAWKKELIEKRKQSRNKANQSETDEIAALFTGCSSGRPSDAMRRVGSLNSRPKTTPNYMQATASSKARRDKQLPSVGF